MNWDSGHYVVIPEGLSESGPHLSNAHPPDETRAVVDRVVYDILGHGAFQRRIMGCSLLAMMVLLCHSLAYRAIASPVDHWCARPPKLRRAITVKTWKSVAIPVEPDGSFSRCAVYDPPLPAPGGADPRAAVSCTQWEYATKFRNRSIVSEWDLVCHRSRLLQLSSSAYMAGAMFGVPIAGLLSDYFGRKPIITGCVTALIFACVGCIAANSFTIFVLARMAVSAMSSAAQVLSFILLYEVTSPEMRAACALLATATGVMLVPIALEIVAAAELSWQASQMLLLVPTVSLVYTHYLLEESPCWLLATWQLKRAEEVHLLAARRNGLVVEKAARFFKKLKAEMRRHAHAYLVAVSVAATDAAQQSAVAAKKSNVGGCTRDFLSGWRAISVFLAWFTVMFCYYGLMLADEQREGAQVRLHGEDVAYLIMLVPITCFTYLGMQSYGQRRTFILLLALLFETTAILMVVPRESSWRPAFVFKVAARAVSAAATSANYVYTAEAFPTAMRSTGLTVAYASGRLGAIFSTAIMSFQMSYTRSFMNVTMMLLALVSVMAIQMAPDEPPKAREPEPGSGGDVQVPAAAISNLRGRSFGWNIRRSGSRDMSLPHTSTQRSSTSHGRASSGESLLHRMPFDQQEGKIAAETTGEQ